MAKTRVLIVEDDGTIAVRLRRLLTGWGYEPFTAGDSEAALQIAAEERPDLALMDIHLGNTGSDGITTAQELRQRFEIPAIYITAHLDDSLLQRAAQTVPYGYLVKPLQELSLRSTLEMAVSKLQADRQLQLLLHEKEMLMQEILHRTKNNMGAIVSLLHLQAQRFRDNQLADIFKEIEHRIQAMLLVQQQLYQSKEFTSIQSDTYFTDLAEKIFHNIGVNVKQVQLCFELAPLKLHPDTAITCGLILNELLTNALKYAFPDHRSGEIIVFSRLVEDQKIEFGVRNNGVGMPDDFDLNHVKTFGLELVTMLAKHQLKGTLLWQQEEDTAFFVRFTQPPVKPTSWPNQKGTL